MATQRRWRRGIAIVTMVAALLGFGVATSVSAEEIKFRDVPETHMYYKTINDLAGKNVISGYPDGTFKLDKGLQRAESAKILTTILKLDVSSEKTPFTDVADGQWYTDSVKTLFKAGYIQGYDRKFEPDRETTRAEYAQMLVNAYDIPEADIQLPFTDVVKGEWYEPAVKALYASGLITGIDEDSFAPNQSIKRGDAVWLLAKTDAKFGPYKLTILHTNDTHANLDNIAKRVTGVKAEKAKNPNALLLDAGDVFQGTLYFNEFHGQADLKFMNLMGYDAMTFGNHEFDLGATPEGHQALVDFIKGAQFPFVSSNIDFSGDEKFTGLFSDLISSEPEKGKIYNGIIKEINGEKVGIFGLTTAETVDISSPGAVKFEDYLAEAERAVKAFEGRGVNKIIALTHIGYDDNANVDNDLTLATKVDGIDVIVGGHSHTTLTTPVVVDKDENGAKKDPTVIVQTGANNTNLGVLDVKFSKNGVIKESEGKLIPVANLKPDKEAEELLKPYASKIKEVSEKEIGVTLEKALENPRLGEGQSSGISVRNHETILGNIITDGMLAKAKEYNPNTVMALQNGGGIRAAIEAGPVTNGEVIKVLPFGNTLAVMDLTGADLKAAFEVSLRSYPGENGGFLHVAGGKVEFDSTKPVGQRVVNVYIKNAEGAYTLVVDNQTYTIATNAFTAQGGDGFDVFAKIYKAGKVTDLGLSDWENFRDHLVSLDKIPTELEGRIVDVAEGK